MGLRPEKKILIRATLSDETQEKLKALVERMRGLTQPVDRITSKFQHMGHILKPISQRMEALGAQLRSMGKVGLAGVSAPLAGLAALGLKSAASSQAELKKLEVVARLPPESLAMLKAEAERIGQSTQFSLTDALEGMKYLSMQGVTGAQNLKEAIGPTMDLTGAAALKSQISLPEVAQILSGVMNAYGFDFARTTSVADQLALAMQNSALTLEELGVSLEKAAPLAKQAGLSLEELLAGLMQLSASGIKGEVAGTAFAGVASRLLKPPAEAQKILEKHHLNRGAYFSPQGTFRDFLGLFQELEKKQAKPAEMMSLLGQEAGKYFISLLGKTGDWDQKRHHLLERSKGTAQLLNQVQMEGFHGDVEKLKSGLETLLERLGSNGGLLHLATQVVNGVARCVDQLNTLDTQGLKTLLGVAGGVAVIPPLLLGLGALLPSLPVLGGLAAMAGSKLGWLAAGAASLGLGGLAAFAQLKSGESPNGASPFFQQQRLDQKGPSGLPNGSSTVTVDFKNLPRGTEVTAPPSSPGRKPQFKLNLQYASLPF